MKNIIFVSILASVILLASFAYALAGALSLSYTVLDDELMPGQETTIFLTFETTTAEAVRGITYSASGGPFLTADATNVGLGSMGGVSSSQTSFKIKADSNAVTTISYVNVKAKYTDDYGNKETNINVPVTIRRAPLLQILSVGYGKDSVEPGTTVYLLVNITNRGQGPAEETIFAINQTTDIFTIIGTSKQIFLDEVNVNQYKTAKYLLAISPNADVGTYNIPVSISYKDETKTQSYRSDEIIGMVISGNEEIMLIKNSQDVLVPGTTGNVNIEIVNMGKQNVRFLTLDLESDGLSMEPSKTYIGKLDSDDSDTSRIKVTGTAPGTYTVNAKLSFNDMFSESYEKQTSFDVTISPVSDEVEIGIVEIAIIVIVAIVLGRMAWSRFRKGKK